MPHLNNPRRGTLQFRPRKRAIRTFARVRSWPALKEAKPLGFAGYKVGMTHIFITDNKSTSMTKGEDISIPVTIIECPPLKTASINFYKRSINGIELVSALATKELNKELGRTLSLPKNVKKKIEDFKPQEYDDIRLLVYTQPRLTTIGKKKPEVFELALGGKIEEKFDYAKEKLGKEIKVEEVLQEGHQIDTRAVTKGKGLQGAVKRHGVTLRSHKSEKGARGPANLGAWTGNRSWTVAHPGQMGYHQRTELNKWLVKIGTDPEEINRIGGFKRYGIVKNNYILLRGSVQGPTKRMIMLTNPLRTTKKNPQQAPSVQYVVKNDI